MTSYTRLIDGIWGHPAELPFRIVLPDGLSRTDPSSFAAEEIAEAGYTAAPEQPDYDAGIERLIWDAIFGDWTVEAIPEPPPPGPPEQVSRTDWRTALRMMGKFASVQSAAEAARDSDTLTGFVIWERWDTAAVVRRSELLAMAGDFGFSPEEVDESLILAADVVAGLLVAAA